MSLSDRERAEGFRVHVSDSGNEFHTQDRERAEGFRNHVISSDA